MKLNLLDLPFLSKKERKRNEHVLSLMRANSNIHDVEVI
jgi:hypothetical protein